MKEYKFNNYSIIMYCSMPSVTKRQFEYIFSQIIDNNREIYINITSLIKVSLIDEEFLKLNYDSFKNQLNAIYYKKDDYSSPIINKLEIVKENGIDYLKLTTHPYFTNTVRNKFVEELINEKEK